MNLYYNLPSEQRPIQRLVDRFNADEELWRKLARKRRGGRLRPCLSRKQLNFLDLLEFAKARAPECVGQWIEP
jgi:hypothetical protein